MQVTLLIYRCRHTNDLQAPPRCHLGELRVVCVCTINAQMVCVFAKALLQNGGQQVPRSDLLSLE